MPPSSVLRATLPVKPSVTTTSTSSVMRSRPSTLPTKVAPVEPIQRRVGQQRVGLLDQRVALGRLLADRQQADPRAWRCRSGRGRRRRPSGRTARATRAGTRRWRRRRAAPSGVPPGTGIGVAMAGRDTPLMRPMRSRARGHGGAGVAGADHGRGLAVAHRLGRPHERGVLHAPHARAGVGVHGDDLGRRDDLEAAGVAELVGPADEQRPGRRARRRPAGAPATISPGAWSPPIASTATGSIDACGHRRRASVDVDGLAAVVPAAVAAHDVGQLGRRRSAGRCCAAGPRGVQAEARRLRLFAFEVFFLGTAMVLVPLVVRDGCSCGRASVAGRPGSGRSEPGSPLGPVEPGWRRVGQSSNERSSRAAQRGSRRGRRPRSAAPRRERLGGRARAVVRHSGASGSASSTASRTSGSRSIWSPSSG